MRISTFVTLAILSMAVLAPRNVIAVDEDFLRIETPKVAPFPTGLRLVNPAALPEGARVSMTAPDMSYVTAVFPRTVRHGMPSAEVLTRFIEPLLRGAGSTIALSTLVATSKEGIPQRKADLAMLSRLVAAEYQGREAVTPRSSLAMVAAFLEPSAAAPVVDRQLRGTRGMTLAEFKADIERQQILYPFAQVVEGVPIEHTFLLASRWQGEGITKVHGRLVERYKVVNRQRIPRAEAVQSGYRALAKWPGVEGVDGRRIQEGPSLLLLPYGAVKPLSGTIALRFSWRMTLYVTVGRRSLPFQIWIDAEDGRILKATPLVQEVAAKGEVWKRDPGVGIILPRLFEVDPATGGPPNSRFRLQFAPVSEPLNFGADPLGPEDVSVPDTGALPVDFTQPPLTSPEKAACEGGNPAFAQVHLFATISLYRDYMVGLGIETPYPSPAWTPRLDSPNLACGSDSDLAFGACPGTLLPLCPDDSTGGSGRVDFLDYGHDNTIIAHEVAHSAVQRFAGHRPETWCGKPTCPQPVGFGRLHDLADAWADHLEDINCTGGWVAKNAGGKNASRYCNGPTAEDSRLPRAHELKTPFEIADPRDHFPEHRDASTSMYADMQIAAAALWQVREGVRSLDRVSGHVQFGVRLASAIRASGIIPPPDSSDLGIYSLLQDLEKQMIYEWATGSGGAGMPVGDPATNKVTAGFAKAGLFAIPPVCIDGDAATKDALFCPDGENGGDAVIDVDDDDKSDDPVLDEVTHPEVDYLRMSANGPVFHVWTGARFVFNGDTARPLPGQAPCNSKFQVELANDPAFTGPSFVVSPWITVPTDNSENRACYGTWSPAAADWAGLQAGGDNSRLYYRARTQTGGGGHQRLSTMPAAGTWTVPAPFAVITNTGQPNF